MKRAAIVLSMLIICGFTAFTYGQGNKKASDLKSVVWLGVDFTAAKFTQVPEDPAIIVNQYLKSINTLVITEQAKFNVSKFFDIPEVTNDIDLSNEFNSKIDPAKLVIDKDHKIDMDQVKEIIKKYNVKDKTGAGLLFIGENFSKPNKSASYYVCFFDLKTKEIIECKEKTAPVTGVGFRNYWASSIYLIMKTWKK
jgi:hypothetical protein